MECVLEVSELGSATHTLITGQMKVAGYGLNEAEVLSDYVEI
jgi:hypothetical protein